MEKIKKMEEKGRTQSASYFPLPLTCCEAKRMFGKRVDDPLNKLYALYDPVFFHGRCAVTPHRTAYLFSLCNQWQADFRMPELGSILPLCHQNPRQKGDRIHLLQTNSVCWVPLQQNTLLIWNKITTQKSFEQRKSTIIFGERCYLFL